MITYLTGASTAETRAADRTDLGILATPASGIATQRVHYPGGWAADNAMFTAKNHDRALAKWQTWIDALDPEDALFATLPDVAGDYAATWAASAPHVDHVRALGFPVGIVLQDGLETDRFVWKSILRAADAVFVGGSTEWKLGPEARGLVAEALDADKHVHVGRVNSLKRLRYSAEIGAHTVDGTFIGFAPSKNAPKVEEWLDTVNGPQLPELAVAA